MFRIILLATLVSMSAAQQVATCNEFIDVILMVDGSSSVGPSIDSYRAGISNLVRRMDINGATQTSLVQLGICYFGTGAVEAVRLSLTNTQNSVIAAVRDRAFPGGRTSYHIGIDCVNENFNRAARAGAKKVVVLVVDGNPDRNARALADTAVNGLKDSGAIVSIIAIADQFVNKQATFRFASDPALAFSVDNFEDFESSTNTLISAVCPEEFIPTTTTTQAPATIPTTTTTTTPRPTREQAPCDNCLIVNGVGYAKAEDCFHYYQCILQEDETWREFRRSMPVGAYWDQRRITGNDPARAACNEDPCRGLTNGTIIGGYENCRARITCLGGISSFVECCPEGTGLGGNGECVASASCNDDCNLLDTTLGTCYLSPDVDGDARRFMANDGDVSIRMSCSIGTTYNDDICGCVHDEELFPVRECGDHPEVRLEFGADGSVRDISRNFYTISTFGISTFEASPGVYAARFNGTSGIRISNANMGLMDQEFTMRVVYSSSGNVQNAAVVSDAECINTRRAVSIFDNNRQATGFVRTLPNQDVSVTSSVSSDRKEVVMQFDGAALNMNTNGALLSSPAGALLANDAFCDGTNIGYSNDAPSFVGDVFEFEIFKCIADGTEGFQRTQG